MKETRELSRENINKEKEVKELKGKLNEWKEYIKQLKDVRIKLEKENTHLKDKLHRRNMQIKDLKEINAEKEQYIKKVGEFIDEEGLVISLGIWMIHKGYIKTA